MNHPPFAYVITEDSAFDSEVLAVGQTLERALWWMRGRGHANGCALGPQQIVTAYFPDGSRVVVPMEACAAQVHEPDDEILAWIRSRKLEVAADRIARPGKVGIAEIGGIGRCRVDDPEDKQLADYKATSPWAWKDQPDEGWWQSYVAPAAPESGPR